MVPRVLIYGADPAVQELVGSALTEADFEVMQYRDAPAHTATFLRQVCQVAVVDIASAPDKGHDVCRQLSESNVPVLALTALLHCSIDVDDGRAAGAEDYLIMPVNPPELVARLRVLLHRHANSRKEHVLRFRDLTIDTDHLQVIRHGRAISLTPTEFRLLSCLVRNAGHLLTSSQLLREARGYDVDEIEAQEIVKVQVNRLRQKIEPDNRTPTYIVNVRGLGYMLRR